MNIVVVYNPKSGSALSARDLRAKFAHSGIDIDSLIPINDTFAKKLTPFIKKQATIAVIGGDGTLSSVAGLLAGTKAVFAPLPGGTLNHFTKDLGVPQNIDEAIAHLAKTKVQTVDVATVNGIVFINNSSVGLYPASLHLRSKLERRIGKWPAALLSGAKAFVRFRTYKVTINGKTYNTPFVFIGNNQYKINKAGGPERTAINKGELSLFVAHTTSRVAFVKSMLYAGLGKARQLNEFEARTGSSFTFEMNKKHVSVSRDGEVNHLHTPLKYAIRVKALKIRY